MKAEELRIWNWIYYYGSLPVQVTSIGQNHINGNEYSYCAPIILTPEILEKAGFEKSGDNEHYFIGHFGFYLIHDGSDWCMKPRINDSLVISYCKYIHQLQNLYYALTSTELTINL